MASFQRRNAPCPCGSGKKFKRCCGRSETTPLAGPVGARDPSALEATASVGANTETALLAAAFTHHQSGQLDAAEQLYREILKLAPSHPDAWHLLALIAHARGEHGLAVEYAKRAILSKPRFAEANNTLGVALKALGRMTSALQAFEQAVSINPAYAEAWYNAGNALQMQGLPTQATERYRKALVLAPALRDARTNLLLVSNYSPDFSREEVFNTYREFAPIPAPRTIRHLNNIDPGRRLKIGYVSPDFRQHPVAYFFEPVLRRHDRAHFEIYCYDCHASGDDVTRRIRAQADHWRDIAEAADEHAAKLVESDQIDVLVDLAHHTRGNRLEIFARKPAPIQVTWLGMPQTTGLSTVDYRITDAWVDPDGLTEAIHTEELLRLPNGALALDMDPAWPLVNALPAASNGYVTFASFNNFAKVNPAVIGVWARILQNIPDATLLIVAAGNENDEVSAVVRARFGQYGISGERIEFTGRSSLPDFLRLHHRADVALDPFPCAGVTTTLHSLWMGVPVITLAGDTPIARGGLGILGRLGFAELVASSPDEYLGIAVRLAQDPDRLAALRRSLRGTMAASIFANPETVTTDLETAYRRIWRKWCASSKTAA